MRTVSLTLLVGGLCALLAAPAVEARCSHDSVLVGPTCVDKYEASVWHPGGKYQAHREGQAGDSDPGQSHRRRGDAAWRRLYELMQR